MTKKVRLYVASIVLFVVLVLLSCTMKKEKIEVRYVPLGDSLAQGMNYNLTVDDGYTDFIKDYLEDNYDLKFFTKGFTKWGYETRHVIRDINDNRTIKENDLEINIQDALKEADLVTISVGANDFIEGLSFDNYYEKLNNLDTTKEEAKKIVEKVVTVIELVKQYAKKQIIVTGYYNPLQHMIQYKSQIDEVIRYYNQLLKEKCKELNVDYVDIFDIFDNRKDLLPNPNDIHPNKDGYKLMAKEVIKHINIDK